MIQAHRERSLTLYLARVLFLLLPTAALLAFVLRSAEQYYSFLQQQWVAHTVYVGAGLLAGFTLAALRFRFLPLFLALLLLWFSGYQIIDRFAVGEFDSFFVSVSFLSLAWLFTGGYLIGWCMQRIRMFPAILSGALLILCIFLIAKGGVKQVDDLLRVFSPVALYGIYLIYTAEALRRTERTHFRFWLLFSGRLAAFLVFLFLVFGGVIYFMYPQIKERVEEYGGGGKEGENQMLQNKKDGTVQNRDNMGLSGNNRRNSNPEPLFCAHIEHYFPGSEVPNPLYLTSYHFTRFDTLTETFERDSTFAFNDEFVPDPSRIPLFFTFTDSSRLSREMASRNKTTVEVEVYKKRLAPNFYVAPSTAYFVQPITVEKDFQKEFSSAYRSKSSVSELNSAYFIYNSEDPQIRQFQLQRFDVLRRSKDYRDLDPAFFRYYTFFPTNGQYRPVKALADSLSRGKKTAIDKVLAVRDHFLERNALGERIFTYADNPGVPGLPGASKLLYFLFESKKGYCAYYAAATVALLRSMGIPSRVVTGFMTVDRSDKNKGWYWFYEDQSHGWVQVYFPEYGWIDFDTTVGNDEAEQSPTPDGTPPMQPPKALMAASGKVIRSDTMKRTATLRIDHLLFRDKEYSDFKDTLNLDLKIARIWKDSVQVPLGILKPGDEVMAVSYAEKLRQYNPEKKVGDLLARLPKPVPTDEVYIRDFASEKKKEQAEAPDPSVPLRDRLLRWTAILLGILLLVLSIPALVYRWYRCRAGSADKPGVRNYHAYRACTLYLHQLGVSRGSQTPWQYARRTVDPRFGTRFADFMALFLKQKYAGQELSTDEQAQLEVLWKPFLQQVKTHYPWHRRFLLFLQVPHFLNYYFLPEETPEDSNPKTP